MMLGLPSRRSLARIPSGRDTASSCDDPATALAGRISEHRTIHLEDALSRDCIVAAAEQQVSCALGDESAILNMKNGVYYGLNPVGARVWNLLRQPRSVRELCDIIAGEYDVQRERCERDILDLLEQMKNEGLVELSERK